MRLINVLLLTLVFIFWWSCSEKSTAPVVVNKPMEKPVSTGPMFQRLDSAHTGIGFINHVLDSIGANVLIYNNFYYGAGVAVGDINNDGLMDLYFGGNQTPDKLYLNLGNLRFRDISDSAGLLRDGGWTTGVNIIDVNGDGWQDIYVSKSLYDDQPNLRINELYLNQGDSTFKESSGKYGLNDFWRTQHANWLDYDRDGDLDCYLVNQPPNPGLFSPLGDQDWLDTIYGCRLMENRDSVFADVTAQSKIGRPSYANSAVSADFNGDGWTDLYVTNDYEGADFLFLNQKDGTFKDGIQHTGHLGYLTKGCDAADINNDGHLDILTTDLNAASIYDYKYLAGGMDATTAAEVEENGGHRQQMGNTVQIYTGDQDGYPVYRDVAAQAGVAYTGWTWGVLAADFNLDGYKDLFYTSGTPADLRNIDAVLATDKYLQTKLAEYVKSHPGTKEVDAWEFLSLDDLMKILPSAPGKHHIYQQRADLTFDNATTSWGLASDLYSPGTAYADLDNDGDLDLVANNLNQPATIYENRATQQTKHRTLLLEVVCSGKPCYIPGVRADIFYGQTRQTLELTSARGFYSASDPRLLFGLGNSASVDSVMVSWPGGRESRYYQVPAGRLRISQENSNLTNTPIKTYLFADKTDVSSLEFVHQENTYNDFSAHPGMPYRLSHQGPALAVGDINANDIPDFYVGGALSKPGVLYRQYADGTFYPIASQPWSQDAYSEDVDAAFFDADNDGDQDLYVVSGGNEYPSGTYTYQDRLYLNDGTGSFTRSVGVLPEIHDSGSRVLPADMDGDGDIDLLVTTRSVPGRFPAPATSHLLKNNLKESGQLKYIEVTAELAPALIDLGTVTSGVWSDIDGDRDLDMVLAGDWMPITILVQSSGKWQRHEWNAAGQRINGWWTALAAEDLDKDGDQDLIVGNAGLNHLYQAYGFDSLYMLSGELDTVGSYDLILAYKAHGQFYPVHGYGTLSARFATVRKKYSGYRSVAQASLADIFGAEKIAQAKVMFVDQWQSLLLENNGIGQFVLRALPQEAQSGPVNAIIMQDFNEDGRSDLVLAGNNLHTESRTIRQDAMNGVCLQNDGALKFTSIPNIQTGLFLPWQVQNMANIRVKQRPALLVACNGERLRLMTR